jgi:tetratricopeptide (TPR) repeat protein
MRGGYVRAALFLALLACGAVPVRAADPVAAASLPFPDDATDFTLVTTLDGVRSLTAALEPALGATPLPDGNDAARTALYKRWKRAMFSALAVRQTEGDTELMVATLAALYRQGMNLGVETCRESALDMVERALAMYPDSFSANWQAAYLYGEMPDAFGKAEEALLKLRELLHSERHYEVERRLALIYATESDKEKALAQVEKCLSLRPDDSAMLELKTSLSEGGKPPEPSPRP